MPSRNAVKSFIPGYYYHIYTRGVNKRIIFKDEQDYSMFLRYLKLYLLPIEILKKLSAEDMRITKFIRMNVSNEVQLATFSLMPNHVHLQVKLLESQGIERLMRRVLTGYAMYFNQKYKRVGHLFQSRYKAAPVLSDEYLVYVSRYIHRNPFNLGKSNIARKFTSLPYFIGEKKASWIHPEEILEYFSKTNKKLGYENFVNDTSQNMNFGGLELED